MPQPAVNLPFFRIADDQNRALGIARDFGVAGVEFLNGEQRGALYMVGSEFERGADVEERSSGKGRDS